MRSFLVAAAALGVVLAPGVAHAAPTDPIDTGCTLLPSGRVDCPNGPPLYSVCTVIPTLPDEGTLVRKSCQLYTRDGDIAIGPPQIFVYPPNDGALPEPTYAPVAPITSAPTVGRVAPAAPAVRTVGTGATPTAAVVPDRAPTSQATPQPSETAPPADAVPSPRLPMDQGATHLSDTGVTSSHGWQMRPSLWVALAAGLVLAFTLVYRRRIGRHRAL